jgi:DNA polymerase I
LKSVVLNIEANGLKPDKIWVITCIDIDTGEEHVFRNVYDTPEPFVEYYAGVGRVVGHNIIPYDLPALRRLVRGFPVGVEPSSRISIVDTLVVSRLLNFSRDGGHSLAAWAPTVGVPKSVQPPWEEFSEALVEHSLQNCRITAALYKTFLPYLNSPRWKVPIQTEHFCAERMQECHENGFYLDIDNVQKLRYTIYKELEVLDEEILEAFPPRVHLVREIKPRVTKFGTLNRNDFRWAGEDLSYFNGGPFSLIEFVPFNPGSPSQIVERLNEAGWQPTEKTKGHQIAVREKDEEKLARYAKTGWMVSETNLNTLPDTAPPAAKKLALRIMLASRARTLTEWIEAYIPETHRVHGTINGLGAWTHRSSHVRPNTGNIPTPQPLNDQSTAMQIRANAIDSLLRTYWCCAPGSHLIGVDAEGIQLRVLAHYINDPRFTEAVVSGKKEDGTDPHTLNKVALGSPCKSRADAKTFIYAWLLGAGVAKVAQILGCGHQEAKQACDDFIKFYPGLAIVKRDIIPRDAARGYFEGFDGRYVSIVGDDQGSREHFTLAGYLQNGEAVVMKRAKEIWVPRFTYEKVPFKLVNFVHDEWVTEIMADKSVAQFAAEIQADAIREAGEQLKLLCPMAGSLSVGYNWKEVH